MWSRGRNPTWCVEYVQLNRVYHVDMVRAGLGEERSFKRNMWIVVRDGKGLGEERSFKRNMWIFIRDGKGLGEERSFKRNMWIFVRDGKGLGEERSFKRNMWIFARDGKGEKEPGGVGRAIYNLAATTLNLNPPRCVVIEDSHIGLTAAKAAGMTCVVTKSGYTADEDFSAADAVFDAIGDTPATHGFDLPFLASLL
ncbi:unnamed protein product [Closterium sp. NIES-53]